VSSASSVTFPAFGSTGVVVTSVAERLQAATVVVHREVSGIDLACNRFRPDSDISRVNDSAGRWVHVSELFLSALEVALSAARATEGAVDPSVGRALVRIGYDRDFAERHSSGPAVDGLPASGWQHVEIDGARSRVRIPEGTLIDLGATAKALTADRASLRAATAEGCGVMVSLGGDLAVYGEPPPGGWTVGMAEDHSARAEPGQTIAIRSGGVATSSTTVRRWSRGGRAMHHVLDPRTGLPAEEVWRTVSVAAATCVWANTASTAAIVLGSQAPAWLEHRGLPARLVAVDGNVARLNGWPAEGAV
jgi:thiamine biosynthesis lipoprotein